MKVRELTEQLKDLDPEMEVMRYNVSFPSEYGIDESVRYLTMGKYEGYLKSFKDTIVVRIY